MKINAPILRRSFLGLILLAALLSAAAPRDAAAIDLQTARSQGLVGERFDGLLGAVEPSPSGDVLSLVRQVNEGRLAKYREGAAASGTDIDTFRRVMGDKIIGQVPSGTFIMGADGQWRRK